MLNERWKVTLKQLKHTNNSICGYAFIDFHCSVEYELTSKLIMCKINNVYNQTIERRNNPKLNPVEIQTL